MSCCEWGRRQVAQGPAVSGERRQAVRILPEEEEESTGSEDEIGGSACEDMRDIASKNRTHLGPTPFKNLRRRVLMEFAEPSPISSDGTPAFLCNRPKLRAACTKLTLEVNNKEFDLVTQRRIQEMLGLLNLYLDGGLHLSWRKTSILISTSQGEGKVAHARRIRERTVRFLQTEVLPIHRLVQARWTVLSDEDIASEIKSRVVEKSTKGFVKAEDVVDLVASPEMQVIFAEKGISKPSISKRTAARWLQKLDWRYQKTRNGMYIDGHEREDVVAYRRAFVERWKTYDMRFHKWDNDGCELPRPNGFPLPDNGPFRLVLITHDESTFYQNDRRKIVWAESTSRPMPQPKGDGQSIMVSDFLTSEWGRLRDGDECVPHCLSPIFLLTFVFREARVIFKAGKNRDGYFSAEDLLAQVDSAIDIFEGLSKGNFRALFLFDNAPSHQKRALDAISARKMSKGGHPSLFYFIFTHFHCHSTEEGLDTPHGWAAHAMRSAPKW